MIDAKHYWGTYNESIEVHKFILTQNNVIQNSF